MHQLRASGVNVFFDTVPTYIQVSYGADEAFGETDAPIFVPFVTFLSAQYFDLNEKKILLHSMFQTSFYYYNVCFS